jgi:chromosome segregation ATPase
MEAQRESPGDHSPMKRSGSTQLLGSGIKITPKFQNAAQRQDGNPVVDALAGEVSKLSEDMRNMATLEHVSRGLSSLTRYMDEVSRNVNNETSHRRVEIEQLSKTINDNLSKAAGVLTHELNGFAEQIASLRDTQLAEIKTDIADMTYRLGEQERLVKEFKEHAESQASQAMVDFDMESTVNSRVSQLTSSIDFEGFADKQRILEEECHAWRLCSEGTDAALKAHLAQVELQKDKVQAEAQALTEELKWLKKSTTDHLTQLATSITELQSKDEARQELLEMQYQRLNTRIDGMAASPGPETFGSMQSNLEELRKESTESMESFRSNTRLEFIAMEERLQNIMDKLNNQTGLNQAGIKQVSNQVSDQLESLTAKVDLFDNTISFLRANQTTLNDDIQGFRKTSAQLEEDIQSIRNIAEDKVLHSLSQLESTQKISEHIEVLGAKIEIVEKAVSFLRTNHASLNEDIQNIRNTAQDQTAQGSQELATELGTARKFHGELLDSVQELKGQLGCLKQEVDNNSKKIGQVQESNAAFIKDIYKKIENQSSAESLKEMKSQLSDLKQDVLNSSLKIDQVQANNVAFTRSNENKIDSSRSSAERVDSRLQELTCQFNSLMHDILENSQNIAKVQESSGQLTEDLEARLQQLTDKTIGLQEDVFNNLQKIGEGVDMKNNNMEVRLQELIGDVCNIKLDLRENSHKIVQLQGERVNAVKIAQVQSQTGTANVEERLNQLSDAFGSFKMKLLEDQQDDRKLIKLELTTVEERVQSKLKHEFDLQQQERRDDRKSYKLELTAAEDRLIFALKDEIDSQHKKSQEDIQKNCAELVAVESRFKTALLEARSTFLEGKENEKADLAKLKQSLEARLKFLEDQIGDNANKHAQEIAAAKIKVGDLDEARADKTDLVELKLTVEERANYLEKLLGESTEKHERDLKDHKAAHTEHQVSMQACLKHLEALIGNNTDKHVQEIDSAKRHLGELDKAIVASARYEHLCKLEDRINVLEQIIGESSDKHAKELKERVDAVEQHNASMDTRFNFLADLIGNKHAKDFKEHKALFGDHKESMEARLKFLEDLISVTSDKLRIEIDVGKQKHDDLDKLIAASAKHAKSMVDLSTNVCNVEERMKYVEKLMGESDDTHVKALQAHKASIGDHKESMESRLKSLENMLGAIADKQSKEIDAAKKKHVDLDRMIAESAKHSHVCNVEERMKFLTKMIGETADRHVKELKDHRASFGEHKVSMETRVKFLEDLVSFTTEKHRKEIDGAKEKLQDVAKLDHLASIEGRVMYLEKVLGESASVKDPKDPKVRFEARPFPAPAGYGSSPTRVKVEKVEAYEVSEITPLQKRLEDFRSEIGQAISTLRSSVEANAQKCEANAQTCHQLATRFSSEEEKTRIAVHSLQSKTQELVEQFSVEKQADAKFNEAWTAFQIRYAEFRKETQDTILGMSSDISTVRIELQTEAANIRTELGARVSGKDQGTADKIQAAVMDAVNAMLRNNIGDLSLLSYQGKVSEHLCMLHAKMKSIEDGLSDAKPSELQQELAAQVSTLRDSVLENTRKLTQSQENNLKSSVALSRRMDQMVQDLKNTEPNRGGDKLDAGQLATFSERLDAVLADQAKMATEHANMVASQEKLGIMHEQMKAAMKELQLKGIQIQERSRRPSVTRKVEPGSNAGSLTVKVGNAGGGGTRSQTPQPSYTPQPSDSRSGSISAPLRIERKVQSVHVSTGVPMDGRVYVQPSPMIPLDNDGTKGAKEDGSVFSWLF